VSLSIQLAKLAEKLGLTDATVGPYTLRRLRPGCHQRASGAWSWVLVDATGFEVMGSVYSAAEVVRRAETVGVTAGNPWLPFQTREVG
jgi:hypothetical protein